MKTSLPIVRAVAITLLFVFCIESSRAQEIQPDLKRIPEGSGWRGNVSSAKLFDKDGAPALEFTGLIWIDGYDFDSGTIEFDARGKSAQPQGSFIGVAFRIVDATNYDAVYFRPFNFHAADAQARSHSVQYMSIPNWPWPKLRQEKKGQFEKPIEPAPDGDAWFHAKVAVEGGQVKVFVNNEAEPSLVAKELSDRDGGSVGLWCTGYGALANVKITRSKSNGARPGDRLAATAALDASIRSDVIDQLLKKIESVYVFPEMGRKMEQAIRARQARKEYDSITNGAEFAKLLTEHLREVNPNDQHLEVMFFQDGIPYDSEKPPVAEDVRSFRESGRRRNYEFRKVERLDGGVGLLQVDGFYPAEWIMDTAASAMGFLVNCDSIILDLRENHGGASGGTLLTSYFFKEETHLTDFYNRMENFTRQGWTYPVAGAERFADKDLYILTSHETFSAAEALAYDMKSLKRATIVGEPTHGGANPTTIFRINDHFSAGIPFARSIHPKTEVDGARIEPDVAVPANEALITAHLLALKKALGKNANDPKAANEFARLIAAREAELDALRARTRQNH